MSYDDDDDDDDDDCMGVRSVMIQVRVVDIIIVAMDCRVCVYT
jgi:hypothetical protein